MSDQTNFHGQRELITYEYFVFKAIIVDYLFTIVKLLKRLFTFREILLPID